MAEAPPEALTESGAAENMLPFTLPKAVIYFLDFLSLHNLTNDCSSAALYQVHEDLRLIRGWSRIRVVSSPRLYLLAVAPAGFDSVFPGASASGIDRTQAVIPVTTDERLSPRRLDSLCDSVRHPDSGSRFRCITLAIVDQDSTTAYYRIFSDFTEIVHPQWKLKKTKNSVDDMDAVDTGNDDAGSYDTKGSSSEGDSLSGASSLS